MRKYVLLLALALLPAAASANYHAAHSPDIGKTPITAAHGSCDAVKGQTAKDACLARAKTPKTRH